MIEILWHGRLGNRMIQYSVACILADRLKLKIYNSVEEICNNQNYYSDFFNYVEVDKPPYVDEVLEPVIDVDDNFIINCFEEALQPGHYKIDGSGQANDLLIKNTSFIRNIYKFKKPITREEGVWVHARLGDVPVESSGTLEYYRKALSKLNCNGGVIATDAISQNSDLIKTLQDEFNLTPDTGTPIQTLTRSRNFNKKVLSAGTFSWWMGTLVDADTIYYYDVPATSKWHMPIFDRPGWIPL